MNRLDIQNLIDKYYNGDTTIEEEHLLLDFLESDTSNDFQSEKAQFLFFKKSREEKPTKELFDVVASEPGGRIIKFRFYVLRAAAVLIVALGLGYLLFFLFRSPLIETSTEANVQSEINLPDGSHVWIHSSSKIRYPIKFDKDKREVFLDGEAYLK